MVEFLVTVCGADLEQKGIFEVPNDNSVHWVTPLWCASVAGHLHVVKYLVRLGASVNAQSDSGSTPVRSACFMSFVEIVKFLVDHGADLKKTNYNGGTCLINSVQCIELCSYLISKEVDINAKDIQEKTALHYSIQENMIEATALLLDNGADPFAKSQNGDDALTMACLTGSQPIFDLLMNRVRYSTERLADAHELIGSTFLDDRGETRVAILHWRLAHHMRLMESIKKRPAIPLRPAYGNAVEYSTLAELDNIASDMDAMRIQSLLICERILGINHKDMLYRLMYRGAAYADSLRYQRCIDLWRLALQIRVARYSITYTDTRFTAQALVRLMLDLHARFVDAQPGEFGGHSSVPRFEDVYEVLLLLTENILDTRELLQVRPVHKKQQENFDKVFKCVTYLIFLLVKCAVSEHEKRLVFNSVRTLVLSDIRSACNNDTLLHLCVSRLNVIKSSYIQYESDTRKAVFPNVEVAKLLIDCGADVNAQNESRSTPLHVASIAYNYDGELIQTLLDAGAHLDQPNKYDDRAVNFITMNATNVIPLINYTTLKCQAATVVAKYKIPYRNQVPKTLENFIKLHQA
ncbi:Protein fem-1 like C [Pseudolycoriella hygida]|uniref:Protein fem-1 like C n=1 Tax=Pseudolycoriella hygida TaxID=35572 RepID=A0A9Q0MI58_9DIPT|nr:Protein fem-1 like C [Pseudolycoriella hygida]